MVVIDLVKRPDHAAEIEVAGPEAAPVGLAKVKVANAAAVQANGVQNGALLDIQMNRVEHVAQSGRTDALDHRHGFRCRVVEAHLQMVDWFQDNNVASCRGNVGYRPQKGDGTRVGIW